MSVSHLETASLLVFETSRAVDALRHGRSVDTCIPPPSEMAAIAKAHDIGRKYLRPTAAFRPATLDDQLTNQTS